MAGKQPEQSSVKSGDVLLLYEEGRGYVYSEITLPKYASVCFHPITSPYSKEDPGLPDINCATFTLQLANEKMSSGGAPVQYGQSIKLRHTATGKYLGVNRIEVARSEPNLRVELLQDTGEEDCQFKILPLHGDYGLGSEVFFDQPVKFENIGVPGHYLNCSSEPYNKENLRVLSDKYELNASTSETPLSLILYHEVACSKTYSCRVGKLLQLSETRESMSIIAKASRFRQPLAYGSTSVDLNPPATIDDVCAQDKYTDVGQPWYPTSLWQFEEAGNPRSGSLMRFITCYRIKHILTRKYIAVVRCEHEDECPEEGICNFGYKVVLKDRTVIENYDEESGNDETVFTPVSPNQQTGTHVVPEGGQLLLRHKQTGLWLNVYHDVSFQWNDVANRPKSPFGPDMYQLIPFYEVDATKRVLSVAKEPRHAFTVHHSSSHSMQQALYSVAGVIPVLTSYFQQEKTKPGVEDSLAPSEELELDFLKQLASNRQYKAFIAHYGVIELLLAMEDDDCLLFAVEVLKLHTSGRVTVYEKNRFVHMTGTISPKILQSVSGIEATASLMNNNLCPWALDIDSQVRDFLKHISTETELILRTLGSVCLIGRKPVTLIQDTIVKRLIRGGSTKDLLYRFVTHGAKVAVSKCGDSASPEKLLSELDEKELQLLELQLMLFARLCQGRNVNSLKAIDKSHAGDAGFISFEEALICVKNESGTIPPSIQAAFVVLTRVMFETEPEESDGEVKATEKSIPFADHAMQLRNWVQRFFASQSMKENPKLFLRAILLLGVQMRKGQFTISDSEELITLFREIVGFLLGNYGRVNFSNELVLSLVPQFFNLQLQSEVEAVMSPAKKMLVPLEEATDDSTSDLMLQEVVLEAIHNHHGNTIPCHLLLCYLNWMRLYSCLEEDSILLPQLTDNAEIKQELQHVKKEHPKLQNFLNAFTSKEQSIEAERLLRDFAGRCIFKGVPHLRNQCIYSSTALDDILGYIFDPNAPIPVWYWCKLSQSKMMQDIVTCTTSMSVECFRFLRALAYQNFEVQKRLVSHLDSILSFARILPVPASELLVEIFTGEPVTDLQAVLKQVESIHLQISEEQIKQFLKVSNRKGPDKDFPGLPLLYALHFIATYDEMDLPVTRNQDYIMKSLKLRRPIMRQGKKLLEEPVLPTMTAEVPKLRYLLGVTDLLAACAEGKSLSIDAKCKSIYRPRELFGILSNPKICPARKTPFMRILVSVYMDTESTEIDISCRPRMWDCLDMVATFLGEVQLSLRDELGQNSIQEVQEILMNALRPFGTPTSSLDTVGVKILQNDMRDLGELLDQCRTYEDGGSSEELIKRCLNFFVQTFSTRTGSSSGSLLYLVKGVLPMLREFYGSVFRLAHSKPGLKKRQTKISTQICRALWGLSGDLEKVLISHYQVKMLHTATASMMNGLLKAGLSPDVNLQQLLDKFSATERQKPVAMKEYERRFPEEEDVMLRTRIKQELHYDEEQSFRKLLALFQGDKCKSCADALGGVLTWIMEEVPPEQWHIRSSLPGLATRCLKALQIHVTDLNNDQDEESFGEFCEQFSKGYVTEVLKLASSTSMEDVSREALVLLQNLLDSHRNPFQRKLAESVNDSEKRNLLSHLSNFLFAIHHLLWDSMTVANARIALQSEIKEKLKEEDEVENALKKHCNIPHSAHEGSEDSTVSTSDVTIVIERSSENIPLVDIPKTTRVSQASLEAHEPERKPSCLTEGGLQELPAGSSNLQLVLRIIGLMCDEQNRTLQNYLRKQPGKFDSVNLVVDVAELLHHIHRVCTLPQMRENEELSDENIEIVEHILQALIELCAGNSANQEVVINRQISHDLSWILTLPGAANSVKLQGLKATTVELLETLMEEVAEGSKRLVSKLRDDDSLQAALVVVANEFYPVFHEKRAIRGILRGLYTMFASSVVHEHAHTEEVVQHEKRMKDSLFRAYHAALSLQKGDSGVECSPETKTPIDFCKKRSKTIEVIYKNDEGESIHTSVSFPYHPDEELREEVKEIVKWNVDRSSAEDKLLDILDWMKAAKVDIRHQRKIRSGFKQAVFISSGLRHYLLLILTFVLNLLVLFNFMVPDDQIPPAVEEIPQANTTIAIDPKTSPEVETALYTLGAFHFILSVWMVIEHYAVNWPHYTVHGWKAVVPRFISNYVFTVWKKTNHGWQESPLSEYLMPPEVEHLEANIYGFDSLFRLAFLMSSLLSLIPTLQGYFYCICLLYIIEESDILNRVLQAVTKNGTSLLWVGALGVIVLYIYAVVSFAFLHEAFFVTSAEVPLYCESLGQCFVSVIRYGLLDNLGLAVPLVSGVFRELGWRLIYDISFFVIVTTIGLNIIFGIIVDTFSELRDARWNSQQDMKDRCFICSIPNYEFDRCTKLANGFQSHITDNHNMWNYIYYSVYVEDTPVRDRTAIQTYIYEMMEKGLIDFFPREAALALQDRQTEVTTEDLSKQVGTLCEGLTEEVKREMDEGGKKLRAEMYQTVRAEMSQQVQDVKEDVHGLQEKVDAIEESVQQTLAASQQQAADLRQALLEEIAALSVNMRAVLDRLPPTEGRP